MRSHTYQIFEKFGNVFGVPTDVTVGELDCWKSWEEHPTNQTPLGKENYG